MARPKRVFSDEVIQNIAEYAQQGCQNKTIANILNIPLTTLKRRFGKLMMVKRSERRQILRQYQMNLAKTNPQMAIFLGKNELEQTDKQTINNESTDKPVELTPDEIKELKRLAGMTTGIKLRTSDNEPKTPVAKKIV